MMTPEEIAEAKRLFYGEHWKIGTISNQLGRHPDAIRRAIDSESFKRKSRHLPRKTDPYMDFIEETLAQYPTLRSTRIFEMIVSRVSLFTIMTPAFSEIWCQGSRRKNVIS
jgi:hypothetical protein